MIVQKTNEADRKFDMWWTQTRINIESFWNTMYVENTHDNFLFRRNNGSFIDSVFMSITMNVEILFVKKEMTMTRSWIIVVSNLKIVRRVFTCIFVSELIDVGSYIFQYIRWFWFWSRKNEDRESVWRNIYWWISQLCKHMFQNPCNSHIQHRITLSSTIFIRRHIAFHFSLRQKYRLLFFFWKTESHRARMKKNRSWSCGSFFNISWKISPSTSKVSSIENLGIEGLPDPLTASRARRHLPQSCTSPWDAQGYHMDERPNGGYVKADATRPRSRASPRFSALKACRHFASLTSSIYCERVDRFLSSCLAAPRSAPITCSTLPLLTSVSLRLLECPPSALDTRPSWKAWPCS